MTSALAADNAQSGGTEGDANAGLLGKLFGGGGGKKVQKAKLGLELQMYYHEEVCMPACLSVVLPVLVARARSNLVVFFI